MPDSVLTEKLKRAVNSLDSLCILICEFSSTHLNACMYDIWSHASLGAWKLTKGNCDSKKCIKTQTLIPGVNIKMINNNVKMRHFLTLVGLLGVYVVNQRLCHSVRVSSGGVIM